MGGKAREERRVLSAEAVEIPVAILTATVPVVFGARVSDGGLNVQAELPGNALQLNAKVPVEPLMGVTVME